MLLKHLTEAHDPIYKIWANQTPYLERLAASLEDEVFTLFSGTVQRAVTKHASDPLELLPLINSMVKIIKKMEQEDSWTYTRWLQDFLNALCAEFVKLDEAGLKRIKNKVDLEVIRPYIKSEYAVKLQLGTNKASRTPDQKKYDEENELYIFIGRPSFVERPPGSDNFKKSLEIERLVKVDRHDANAHQMAHHMKMRARFQGENSEVYMINLPKGAIEDTNDL